MEIFTRPPIERDRYGRYKLPHPDTGKQQAWRRTTTFIKVIQDTWNLQRWAERNVMVGASRRPDLVELVSAIPDPLGPANRDTVQDAADAAKETAGTSTAANLGTALHGYAETLLTTGTLPDHIERGSEVWDRLEAFHDTWKAWRFETRAVEVVSVNTDLETAGTSDFVVADGTDMLRIADLKTGSVTYGALEYAMQLSAYADGINTHGVYTGDGYAQLPAIDRAVGYIIHLPSTGDVSCDVHFVDLELGHSANQVAKDVWAMRALGRQAMRPAVSDIAQRRADTLKWVKTIGADNRKALAAWWPDHLPSLKSDDGWTHDRLTEVTEQLVALSFGLTPDN